MALSAWLGDAQRAGATPPARDVVPGIATTRLIPGKPYDMAGKRLVFCNWYYIQPGDLDWVNAKGESVYVKGKEGPFDAQFVGKSAPRGIRLAAQAPTVMGPLEHPHRCILQDGKLYRGWTDDGYFESDDAMHWTRKASLKFDKESDGLYQIFIDPGAEPAARFKSVWASDDVTSAQFQQFRAKRPNDWEPRALLHYQETGKVSAIRGSVSPDGINWKTLPEPLVVEYADTLNTAYYDAVLRQYVLYTRTWQAGPRSAGLAADIRNSWTDIGRRAIGRTASDTFRAFPVSQTILQATPRMLPSEVLYTNCHTAVPGAPDQHLMFPAIWNASRTDTTRIALAASNDGIHYDWVPGGELMETQAFGQWNGGCIWALPNLIELPNGDWALPYLSQSFPHKYPRGLNKGATGYAVWPRGRMVALEAPEQGECTLMPLIVQGGKLKINAVTKRAGSIRVEVLGDAARTLEKCQPIVGDQFWTDVQWTGAAADGWKAGQGVTLRIVMDQAQIFGLEFE